MNHIQQPIRTPADSPEGLLHYLGLFHSKYRSTGTVHKHRPLQRPGHRLPGKVWQSEKGLADAARRGVCSDGRRGPSWRRRHEWVCSSRVLSGLCSFRID